MLWPSLHGRHANSNDPLYRCCTLLITIPATGQSVKLLDSSTERALECGCMPLKTMRILVGSLSSHMGKVEK